MSIGYRHNLIGGLGIPIALECGAGLFDFSWNNPACRKWVFPDGSISYDERPTRTLTAPGTVYLYCNDFSGVYQLVDNSTNTNYLGDIIDTSKLTYWLNLQMCSNLTGQLSDCNIYYYLRLASPLISGSLSDLQGRMVNTLDLQNCTQITGSLEALQGKLVNYINLSYCAITGVYTPVAGRLPIVTFFDYTDISTSDMDQNLINYAAQAALINKLNGTFSAAEMTRTATSDDAIATLTGLGWTVIGLTKI